jgi:hypothetical protein
MRFLGQKMTKENDGERNVCRMKGLLSPILFGRGAESQGKGKRAVLAG